MYPKVHTRCRLRGDGPVRLASMIGCKRVAVTRAFRKLEEGGAVELKERHILVEDIGALKNLAEASQDGVRIGGFVFWIRSFNLLRRVAEGGGRRRGGLLWPGLL